MLARSMQLRYQVRNSLGVKCVTPGLIHLSAWNRNSANFAFWAFSEVHQKGSNITHLHDASEPLFLSTFLLSATGIGRRGGHSMEQRKVVLYARSRSLRCWRAKR